MKKSKIAIIGTGNRGFYNFGRYIKNNPNKVQVVAITDSDQKNLDRFAREFSISESRQYYDWKHMLELKDEIDAVFISTPDSLHYEPAKDVLEAGYPLLLEKPISNNLNEILVLEKLAKEKETKFMICHTLRYSSIFLKVKELLTSGKIGQLKSIQYNENVAYDHFAHSFVRGNWRNESLSSPFILQKSCHDLDILYWFAESECKLISSFGELSYFKEENKPKGSSDRCYNCKFNNTCIFSAVKAYEENINGIFTQAISVNQTLEGIKHAIKTGPYGRCVYNCDNDVVDHQVTILEFENGVTATFNLSAFNKNGCRTFKLMGSRGEIGVSTYDNIIVLKEFSTMKETNIKFDKKFEYTTSGDMRLIDDFVNLINGKTSKKLTNISSSVHSHILAFAAEESRHSKNTIKVSEFYKKKCNELVL